METKRTALIQDLEDNYVDYLDDALGYRWDCWDVLSLGQIDRHDAILENDPNSPIDLGLASDLERWAFCRVAKAHKLDEEFVEAVRLILSGERDHDGLAYDEIFYVAVSTLAEMQHFDEARLMLDQGKTHYPDFHAWSRLSANITYREDAEGGREAFREFANSTSDLEDVFELAEDALKLGDIDLASEFAQKVSDSCSLEDAIWVDLQSLQRAIEAQKSG